jgi:hypothetical protein
MKTLLLPLILFPLFVFGQNSTSKLYIQSGTYTVESNIDRLSQDNFTEQEKFLGETVQIISFKETPDELQKEKLSQNGIELLNYIPSKSFYARIQLDRLEDIKTLDNIIAITPIKVDYKLTPELKAGFYPDHAVIGNDVQLEVSCFEGFQEYIRQEVGMLGAVVLEEIGDDALSIQIPIINLPVLYEFQECYFFRSVTPPGEPENLAGRTNHRSNFLASDYASGLQYDATGVTIMMQDDGYIGEHIDFKGRIDQSGCASCSTNPANDHGDHVAGTIMGAGNINPAAKGMAYGAELLVYGSGNNNYNSVPNLYNNEDLVITSKSYSAGCNGGYDNLARSLDQMTNDLNSIIHVFSAGNAGQDDCGYGPSGWGNITGGHKSGKNVLAVGNLNGNDVINSSSSRGPATDGRIKPDICGVGTSVNSTIPGNIYGTKTGTSMSCPGVAGTIGQLYDAYRDLNGGNNPTSGLIKAAVLNTGEDLGNPGPDFIYGWGRINARASYELLRDGNYARDTITQNENESVILNVPAATKELRVMVYWTDAEGSTSAQFALVNDLNMFVVTPANDTLDPWVLDHTPNVASLNALAVRERDSINNVEQVTIDNPAAGTYEINIDGFNIPQGPQEYFIVYQFVRDEITITYPIGGEGFDNPGTIPIRWDSPETNTDFTLEYTLDDGASWSLLNTAPADQRYFNWGVPAGTQTGLAKIRITNGSAVDESDSTFSIIATPDNLSIEWACPDSLKFTWNEVSTASQYEVSMLGSKYMDSVASPTLNSIVLPILSTDTAWISVKSLGVDGARGERAIAIQKLPGQWGCLWSDPIADFTTECENQAQNHCFYISSTSANVDQTATYSWYFPGSSSIIETNDSVLVCYDTPGIYDAAMVVNNSVGSDSIYIPNYVNILPTTSITYLESFENYSSLMTTDSWDIDNPQGQGFTLITTNGLTGNNCVRLSNFGQAADRFDQLISGPVDLSSLDPNIGDEMTLSFRYAHRKRNDNDSETLRLKVRNSCDGNWVIRKTIPGIILSNATASSYWEPTADSQWVTIHVSNITSQFWTDNFQFLFEFESDGGNNLYIDDINIYKGAPSNDLIAGINEEVAYSSKIVIYPNPSEGEINVIIPSLNNGVTEMEITGLNGKLVYENRILLKTGDNIIAVNLGDLSDGMYILKLNSKEGVITERINLVH